MKLYGHPMSTCTRKVLCALAEKNVKADFQLVDIMSGAQKTPDHLGIQPFGQVPVLEDDGFVLFESRAICRYLDEKLGGPKLHGSDLKSRALIEQWISVETSNFTPAAMKIIMSAFFGPMMGKSVDEAVVNAGREGVKRCVEVMERQLGKTQYVAGDSFSIADIGFLPYITYLMAAKQGDLFESPNVAAWWNRVSTRESWKTATGG
jgi:glutathione S-transferase